MDKAIREDIDFDEWRHFDDRESDDDAVGPARAAEIKGRCTNCWGPVTATKDRDGRLIHIECRLCGLSVKDEDAVREAASMKQEADGNMPKARVGRGSKYREDARFVLKILPDMDRDKAQFHRRVTAKRTTEPKRRRMGRGDFRPGTAGYLYAQARVILSGLEELPRLMPAIDLSDFVFGKPQVICVDSSSSGAVTQVSATVPTCYRRPTGPELMARLGTTMVAAMTAAFASELAMKAILMTRLDEAKKIHDLAELYEALPRDSRERLVADFAGIADVLKDCRQAFDKWRYFDVSAGENAVEEAIKALWNTDRIWELGKAARVIVDECVVTGLTYEIQAKATFEVTADRGDVNCLEKISLSVDVGEAAIPWDQVLASGPKRRK